MAILKSFSVEVSKGTWSPRIEAADAVIVSADVEKTSSRDAGDPMFEASDTIVRKAVLCIALRYGQHQELVESGYVRVWGTQSPYPNENEEYAGHPVTFVSSYEEALVACEVEAKALAEELGIPYEGFLHNVFGCPTWGRAIEF